jgi:hypothetical protein
MTDLSQSDRHITPEEAARGVELVVRHSTFRTMGELTAKCDQCDFVKRGSRDAVTAAARRHVRAFVDHDVWTTRIQQKITRMRKVTVLR